MSLFQAAESSKLQTRLKQPKSLKKYSNNMNKMASSLLLAIGIIIFLGLSAFFVKVAVGQIGSERALFWAVVAYIVTDIMILAGLYKMGTPLMFESANW